MSEKRRIADLYGSEYQICWRRLLGFFGSLSAADRGFHGRISASGRISRIENHETIPSIHHGESSTAANRVSSFVPEDAGALANLWTPIPHLRSEMSGDRSSSEFGFFATARSEPCFLYQLPPVVPQRLSQRFISAFSVIRARD